VKLVRLSAVVEQGLLPSLSRAEAEGFQTRVFVPAPGPVVTVPLAKAPSVTVIDAPLCCIFERLPLPLVVPKSALTVA
jgi:hypothetical protein